MRALDSSPSPVAPPRVVAVLLVVGALAACSLPGPDAGKTAVARYDPASGRLQRLEFDSTRNGRNDAVGIMDGARVERIEVDENEDGKIDRWEFYGADRRLERVGFSRRGAGVMDAVAVLNSAGEVARIEMSIRSQGRFDRVEHYAAGVLARVEEDTNGDGRVDKWETYGVDPDGPSGQSPSILMAAFDDDFRGTPNRRVVYRPDGSVLRIELDPDDDGAFEAQAATHPE
jgi:hypothetical protein